MVRKVYASEYAKLDSDVLTGGGTDDTQAIQAILDTAPQYTGLHLVMDGAALVHSLKVHSNTTIECPTKSCGFYMADGTDSCIITNYNAHDTEIHTFNVSLLGGTYNHNCLHQAHHLYFSEDGQTVSPTKSEQTPVERQSLALEFYGVQDLLIRDVTVRDMRTYAVTVGCFRRVTIENVWLELENEIPKGNQDGFHFWGPGQFLTLRNVGGRTEDDFMNIGPDERDCVSSITDVLIDGVFLDDAWQGIRLLSRGSGRLDRVTIRNVTGTYRSFGFYITPWFHSPTMGNYGDILLENIHLTSVENLIKPYHTDPFLFYVGGDIESITLRNIRWANHCDNRQIFRLGYPYDEHDRKMYTEPTIGTLAIEGLRITEEDSDQPCQQYMDLRGNVKRFILRDIDVARETFTPGIALLRTLPNGHIERLMVDRIYAQNLDTLLDLTAGVTDKVILSNILLEGCNETLKGEPERVIGQVECID